MNKSREPGTELLAIDLHQVDGLQVTMMADDKPSFYRHLSDNTKLLFAYHLYTHTHNPSGNVLLFDEPNNGFHATAQELLLQFLRRLSAKGNLVIVSTHSEYLIDPHHLTGVRLGMQRPYLQKGLDDAHDDTPARTAGQTRGAGRPQRL